RLYCPPSGQFPEKPPISRFLLLLFPFPHFPYRSSPGKYQKQSASEYRPRNSPTQSLLFHKAVPGRLLNFLFLLSENFLLWKHHRLAPLFLPISVPGFPAPIISPPLQKAAQFLPDTVLFRRQECLRRLYTAPRRLLRHPCLLPDPRLLISGFLLRPEAARSLLSALPRRLYIVSRHYLKRRLRLSAPGSWR